MDEAIISIAELNNWWGIAVYTLITIVCATLFSAVIGFEREFHGHAAGLRTHILVAIGSSLIMTISIYGFRHFVGGTRDPARLAAQVVSGIGFLGAGTIMQTGTDIRGLTTAATLWFCGGIGLACGCGFILEALIATLVAFIMLVILRHLEKRTSKRYPKVVMVVDGETPILREALASADKYGLSIKDISSQIIKYRQKDCLKITITLAMAAQSSLTAYSDDLRGAVSPYEVKVTGSN